MLNIGEAPVSSVTGFAANAFIAASLLWWQVRRRNGTRLLLFSDELRTCSSSK